MKQSRGKATTVAVCVLLIKALVAETSCMALDRCMLCMCELEHSLHTYDFILHVALSLYDITREGDAYVVSVFMVFVFLTPSGKSARTCLDPS